jgi:DNA polymerase III delta prime subunit
MTDRTTTPTPLRQALHRVARFRVTGVPEDAPRAESALLRSRLESAARDFSTATGDHRELALTVATATTSGGRVPAKPDGRDDDADARIDAFRPEPPRYGFDDLVLPDAAVERLLLAVAIIELRTQVFDEWGLRRIQPRPGSAISLHGDPGTGKTLAAHAVADRLGRPILCARYSQLESMYHGEGPKNLRALFRAAHDASAVLFIDEAETLLSARFTNVAQSSEHAINAMRSELLIALDEHEGLVIVASNLAHGYDRAFESRVRHVVFPLPDAETRSRLWRRHLVPELPIAADVDVDALAAVPGISGRDIRNAVVEAATSARLSGRSEVAHELLMSALADVRSNAPATGDGATVLPAGSSEEAAVLSAARRRLGVTVTEIPIPHPGQQPAGVDSTKEI